MVASNFESKTNWKEPKLGLKVKSWDNSSILISAVESPR